MDKKTGERPFTVAAVQAAPVFLNREATVEKACGLVAEAAANGAKIIVVPEVFVPGYPDWVWVVPAGQAGIHRELYSELLDQSVTIPSPATDKLCRAAKQAGAYVVMGINERNAEASGGSIYNTLLYIDDKGQIMGRHRKLIPTAGERLVWTPGNGSTLDVYDTPYGKLGGLICWENYMPLARYAMYAWGTQIYVAATWDCADTWIASLQHIAKEGRIAVIGCCIAMTRDQIPNTYKFKESYPPAENDEDRWINRGASAIVNPDGHIVAGPAIREETILYAEIDPAELRGAKYWNDAAGHYARPDVFQLTVNRDPNPMIGVTDNEHQA
ncbi:MAG: carbon-nitrogen hydrolase family protein, partial [Dehalococcoidia bacterium]